MKKALFKVLHQSNQFVFINIIIISLSLSYLIIFNKFNTPIAYILYLLMSILFIIVCIKIYDIITHFINTIIHKNKYLRKYHANLKIRYQISLFSSLILNTIYAIFKLISGIVLKSLWLISFAIYYFILIILRISIARYEIKKNKNIMDECICYRKVGIILLFINLFITIVVLIIVNGLTLKRYNEIIAISVACYTFYLMINSLVTLIKYHKYKNLLMSSAKIINVVTSLISMLSLEIIMLSTFSPEKIEYNETLIATTGLGIGIIIIGISLHIIIKSTELIKSLDNNSRNSVKQ